jgi:hypothetical protein
MRSSILIAVFSIAAAALASRAEDAASGSKKNDFGSFQIIVQRNIFNPNRSGRSGRPVSDTPRPAATEGFGLLGTMIYEKGKFAFFGGTSSNFKKVVSPSDKIAGYRVEEIEPNLVKLQPEGTNSQTIELKVGQQLKRQEGGEWRLSESREPFTQASKETSTNQSHDSSNASAAPGDESDVLKRLLQKREEELKK